MTVGGVIAEETGTEWLISVWQITQVDHAGGNLLI